MIAEEGKHSGDTQPIDRAAAVRHTLRAVSFESESLDTVARDVWKRVLAIPGISDDQRQRAKALLRAWNTYAQENHVSADDPYMVRVHAQIFAEHTFPMPEYIRAPEEIVTIPLTGLTLPGGESLEHAIEMASGEGILTDPDVVTFGGVARMALRAYLLQTDPAFSEGLLLAELPIADVDIAVRCRNGDESIMAEKSTRYGSDVTGTRYLPDEDIVTGILPTMLANLDCSMNEVVLYRGKIYCTRTALEDNKTGAIRTMPQASSLFGDSGYAVDGGSVYARPRNIYRVLAFLLREKGEYIVITRENWEHEIKRVGIRWLTLLFVKLLKMKDATKRHEAVYAWYVIARENGVTTTEHPADFLRELLALYPDFRRAGQFDEKEQARWVVGKLILRGLDTIGMNTPKVTLFTDPTDILHITKPNVVEDARAYDWEMFERVVDNFRAGSIDSASRRM